MAKRWRGLFFGFGGDLSLGRLSFWLVLGLAVYFWLARPVAEFPPTLENALTLVLAYNFGTKAVYSFGKNKGEECREQLKT